MQRSFWWWQFSDRYIVPPPSPTSIRPSLISLLDSVDVKLHERRRQVLCHPVIIWGHWAPHHHQQVSGGWELIFTSIYCGCFSEWITISYSRREGLVSLTGAHLSSQRRKVGPFFFYANLYQIKTYVYVSAYISGQNNCTLVFFSRYDFDNQQSAFYQMGSLFA